MANPYQTEEKKRRLAETRNLVDAGLSDAEIARRLNVSLSTVWAYRGLIGAHKYNLRNRSSRRTRKTRKPCLMCRDSFLSEGPHERVCSTCKESAAWQSGPDCVMRVAA